MDAAHGIITLSEDGFAINRGTEFVAIIRWDVIEEIRAYKADLFSYDLICWGFCCSGNEQLVEVHEEMEGFTALKEAARVRFGIRDEDWWSEVAFPAFATNMTVIWSKKGNTESSAAPRAALPDGSRPARSDR